MLFNIGKTRFKLSFSFVAVIVIMTLLCEEKIVLYSLLSSVMHESGHLCLMWASGDLPKKVYFTLFGMRIDRFEGSSLSYKKEILISLGGIIFNLCLSLLCYIIYRLFDMADLMMLSVINGAVAAVNLLPVGILDGGRAVNYIFLIYNSREKSERYSEELSTVFIIIFTGLSFFYTAYVGLNISLICINIYLIFITIIKKWS